MPPKKVRPELRPAEGHPLLSAAAFSADGTHLAVSRGASVSLFRGQEPLGRAVPRGEEPRAYRALSFAPDGRSLLAVGDTKAAWAFEPSADAARWAETGRLALLKRPTSVAHAPDGRAVVGDRFGDVVALPAGQPLDAVPERKGTEEDARPLAGHLAPVRAVALLEGGRLLASADGDEKVRVARFPRGEIIEAFCLGHAAAVTCLAEAGAGRLVSGSADGTVRLWEARTGRQLGLFDVAAARAAEDGAERARVVEQMPALGSTPAARLRAAGLGLQVTAVHYHAARGVVLVTAHPLAAVLALRVTDAGALEAAGAAALPSVPASSALEPRADACRLLVIGARGDSAHTVEVPAGAGAAPVVAPAAALTAALAADPVPEGAPASVVCEDKSYEARMLALKAEQVQNREDRERKRAERAEAKRAAKDADREAKRASKVEKRAAGAASK